MNDEQDKRCHALTYYLHEFHNSSGPQLSTGTQHAQAQLAQAQAEPLQLQTLAPPVDRPRQILN